ncbi:MAG TPA: hypothetical protein VKV69_05075 [Actinomycetota bacterium]|nr:hypothetical protein [Actinomycetota bacterium]
MTPSIAALSGLPAIALVLGVALFAWCIIMAVQRRRWWWALAIFLIPFVGPIVFLIANPEPSQQTGPRRFDG